MLRPLRFVLLAAALSVAEPAPPRRCPRASAAAAPPLQAELFVSTAGNDASGDGSRAAPFASVARAQAAVRALAPLSGDVAVSILAGAYVLEAPLVFGGADAAPPDLTITYRASPPGAAVSLSGGTPVPGPWTRVASPPGSALPVYRAAYNGPPSRQLIVDGRRAAPARVTGVNASLSWNFTADGLGYVTPHNATLAAWATAQPRGAGGAQEQPEFVYTGRGSSWTESRCRTTSVSSDGAGGSLIVMAQPCFGNGRARGGSGNAYQHISTPWSVENIFAGLIEEGSGFLSLASGEAFFATAGPAPSRAVVPTLEALVVVNGTDDGSRSVRGLAFEGLTFEDSTWLFPSTGDGYIDNQAGQIYVGPTGSEHMLMTPGAVQVRGAANVSFAQCTFRHLGATALVIDGGSVNCSVTDSDFYENSGGAIFLGDVTDATAPLDEQDGYHLVANNHIENLPVEYHGCGALVGGYVHHVDIVHNTIINASDGSIELGWGWSGEFDKAYSDENRVLSNKIVNSNWLLYDCGSIYVNGYNAGSEIAYNYCANQTQLFGALYPDEGSTDWHVHDNVVDHALEWLHIWTNSILNITVEGNFFGPSYYNITHGSNCSIRNNTWVPDGLSWPDAARAIMAGAGVVSGACGAD
jgi:hypothetical protein